MHELLLAADESLIHFNFAIRAAELRLPSGEWLILHPQANPMQHKPCRLLRDSKRAMNLPRTDTVLAVGNHPHYREPLVQTQGRFLKDRARLDAELRLGMASLALPETARGNERSVVPATSRANNLTVRPAPRLEVVQAVVGVRKVLNRLGKSLRSRVHA